MAPRLHFQWKLGTSEKLPADSQRDRKDRHTGGEKDKRQTGKKRKNLPNQDDKRWEPRVSVVPAADGRPPAALLRPRTLPSPPDQTSLAWHPRPASTDGQRVQGGPPSQAPSPQTPAASHQRQPRGPPLVVPTYGVCQRQGAGGSAGRGGGRDPRRGQQRPGEHTEPPSTGPAGDRRCHRYFGTPGRVLRQPPPQPSGPLSLRTSFGRTHLYAICPQPHPSMRGLAAPHPRPPPLTHGKYQHFEKQRWGSRNPHAEAPGGGRCH